MLDVYCVSYESIKLGCVSTCPPHTQLLFVYCFSKGVCASLVQDNTFCFLFGIQRHQILFQELFITLVDRAHIPPLCFQGSCRSIYSVTEDDLF